MPEPMTRERFINRYQPRDQMMLEPFTRDLDALLAGERERCAEHVEDTAKTLDGSEEYSKTISATWLRSAAREIRSLT